MKTEAFVLLVAALLLLPACRPPDAGDVDPPPAAATDAPIGAADSRTRVEVEGEPIVGEANVLVYLLEDGEGVSGAQVEVTGDMTHAGMVPVIATAVEAEPGLYRTEGFEFTMAGDWILTAEIELPDGTKATTESAVAVSAP